MSSRIGGTPQKISHAASQMLFDNLKQLDMQLDKYVAEANAAMSTIGRAVAMAQAVYEKRCVLAGELGQLAPEDFTGTQGGSMAPMAPYSRFQRQHPFPTAALGFPVPASPPGWGHTAYEEDPR